MNFDDPSGMYEGLGGLMGTISSMARIGLSVGKAVGRVWWKVKFTTAGFLLGDQIANALDSEHFTRRDGRLVGVQLGAAMDIAASPRGAWTAFMGGVVSATIEFFFQGALAVLGHGVTGPKAMAETVHAFAEGAFDTALSARLAPWNPTGGPMSQALPQLKPMVGFFTAFWPLLRGSYREQLAGNTGATPAHFFESLLFMLENMGVSSLANIAPVRRRAVRIVESGVVQDLFLIASQTSRMQVADRIWDVVNGWMSEFGQRLGEQLAGDGPDEDQ